MSSTAKLWETDAFHTLLGVQDGPSPMEKGVGISSQTIYVFTLGPSHPTPRNLLEIREHHLNDVRHCWVTLLKLIMTLSTCTI